MSDKVIINLNPDGTIPLRTVIDILKEYDPDTPYIIQRKMAYHGCIGEYASDKSMYYNVHFAANFITYEDTFNWGDFYKRSLEEAVDLDKAAVLAVSINSRYTDEEGNGHRYILITIAYEKEIIDDYKNHTGIFHVQSCIDMVKNIKFYKSDLRAWDKVDNPKIVNITEYGTIAYETEYEKFMSEDDTVGELHVNGEVLGSYELKRKYCYDLEEAKERFSSEINKLKEHHEQFLEINELKEHLKF